MFGHAFKNVEKTRAHCGMPPAESWLDETITLLPAAFITVTTAPIMVTHAGIVRVVRYAFRID
jgi:hypothetical protein